ncbi:MAG: hypothetical protein F6J99_13925 [Moorea sp. SIO4G3]|nr:hypothetical protein [Moorena sp. SIO4G3]
MTYSHTDSLSERVGFLPTPPNGIGFRRRCANGYTGYFINDTVRSYRKKSGAFMVSRLCITGLKLYD